MSGLGLSADEIAAELCRARAVRIMAGLPVRVSDDAEALAVWLAGRAAAGSLVGPGPEDEATARAFHEAYERLAPEHGYETREASAKPWAEVPEQNRGLMVAVVADLRSRGVISPAVSPVERPGGEGPGPWATIAASALGVPVERTEGDETAKGRLSADERREIAEATYSDLYAFITAGSYRIGPAVLRAIESVIGPPPVGGSSESEVDDASA